MNSDNRRFNRFAGDANSPLTDEPGDSLHETDRAIFGGDAETLNTNRMVAKGISILDIHPDPTQPRRQIPSAVRRDWFDDNVQTLIEIWVSHYAAEKGVSFEEASGFLGQLVSGVEMHPAEVYNGEVEMPKPKRSAVETGLMEVIQLATDIRQRGLINPITITKAESGWQIETGERRWLAYWLLHLTFGGEDWTRIPAREVEAPSVWRQASENTARQQLNAISKARQLALLIMALYEEQGAEFLPYERFPHDRRFYAQVADGNRYRIPHGEGQRVLDAMNLTDPGYLRKFRMLLSLPDEIWTAADDYSTSENWLQINRRSIPSDMLLLRRLEQDAGRS